MCSSKVLGTAAAIVTAPVTIGASLVGGAIVKGAVGGVKSLAGGIKGALTGGEEAPAAAPVAPIQKDTIDTTKNIYQQDVTAKAVAQAQVKEQKAIKARKGTGATILTNPLGIEKNATIAKPMLGVVSQEGTKSLLGS